MSPAGRIDVHHHFIPPFYAEAVNASGGDPSGWPLPPWTLPATLSIMNRTHTSTTILSVTAPGVELPGISSEDQVKLARQLNEHASDLRNSNPTTIGFFATVPSLLDTPAALSEITYALDVLHADGVTLFTHYGDANYYLGHPSFRPIWEALNARKAVVFIHPTHPVDTNLVDISLPQPVADYTHETTRTALDLIMSGYKREFPDVKIILSHAGGTLPMLLTRAALLIEGLPERFNPLQKSATEIMEDGKSFYFDLALSTSGNVLDSLLRHFPKEHVLFGSDFPHAGGPAVLAFSKMLDEYEMDKDVRKMVEFGNGMKLFQRLSGNSA